MARRCLKMKTPWFELAESPGNQAASCRLFCFPYAGAGASIYRSWRSWLPDHVDLAAVQLPGREGRLHEPLITRMEQVTADLAEAIAPLLDRPFAFFGHSTGAMICFALARELRRRSLPMPQLLMLSAQNTPRQRPSTLRHQLNDAEFTEVLRACDGTPDLVLQSPELLQLLLPRIRADGAIYETYDYRRLPPLTCRIAVFFGLQDSMASGAGARGWESETRASFHCYDGLPGGHFFLHEAEQQLAGHVTDELARLLPAQASKRKGHTDDNLAYR